MCKSILMHKRDNKEVIKSNFVTSYLTFRGSISILSIIIYNFSMKLVHGMDFLASL